MTRIALVYEPNGRGVTTDIRSTLPGKCISLKLEVGCDSSQMQMKTDLCLPSPPQPGAYISGGEEWNEVTLFYCFICFQV